MFKYIAIITISVFIKCLYSEWSPDPFCPYPSDQVTKYPCYGNCSVYWACFEGSKFLVECSEGNEFNIKTRECSSPEEAECDPYLSTTTTVRTTQTETSSISTTSVTTTTELSSSTSQGSTTTEGPYPNCPNPSEDIIYKPYKGDCSQYWECFEGEAYLYKCPTGLWWHQEVLQCDYPGDYCSYTTSSSDSSTTVTTTETSIFTTTEVTDSTVASTTTVLTTSSEPVTTDKPDDIICPNPNDTPVYFLYSGDCTKYWECFEGVKYINSCPSETWWNQNLEKCDIPGDYCQFQ